MTQGVVRMLACAAGGLVTGIVVANRVRRRERGLRAEIQGRDAALAKAAAAEAELDAFTYSVAHDLRAPLRAIDGFSRVLEDDHVDQLDPAGRDALRRVRTAAARMGRQMDELLALSRLTRQPLRPEQVDLSTMASSIVAELAARDAQREASISVQPDLVVTGDRGMLRIALQHLLENAWKFTRRAPRAEIAVGGYSADDGVEYFIRDNGAGFDMGHADKLFGAFQRLHSERDFEGLGIGLATVQRIVRLHGGAVRAESRVGEGAAFYFTLNTSRR